jgi:hypothetical protein
MRKCNRRAISLMLGRRPFGIPFRQVATNDAADSGRRIGGTVAHRGKLYRITMNISATYDRTVAVKTRYRKRTSRCPYVARSV